MNPANPEMSAVSTLNNIHEISSALAGFFGSDWKAKTMSRSCRATTSEAHSTPSTPATA